MTATPLELRRLHDEDLPALRRVDEQAFATTVTDARWAIAHPALERDRQLGAFDRGRLVGHTGALTSTVTLPGARSVPMAAVTWVSVAPTHRRRGVLTALLTEQLAELHTQGEPLALLWASEAAIYRRFGFGAASRRVTATVPRGRATLRPLPEPERQRALEVTVDPVAEALDQCRALYDALEPTTVGFTRRSAQLWAESSFDAHPDGGGPSALRYAVVAEQGRPLAYAWFRTDGRWDGGIPAGTTTVVEQVGRDAVAVDAVLRLLLDLDLTDRTQFSNLPVDHPLLTRLVDPRRSRPTLLDQLWARPVRVEEALASRAYTIDVDCVLEVQDRHCPWNSGRWRLSGGPAGAVCTATTEAAEVVLPIEEVGAALLGDPSLAPACAAGLVQERRRGAVDRLHLACTTAVAPWTPSMF